MQIVNAAESNTITITFVDTTNEKWIASNNACIELVDNTKGHDKYIMEKVDDVTWSVQVPETAYNITFNRFNSEKTELWNSWSAGGRDGKVCYYAEGTSNGRWIETEGFKEGDIIFLDVTNFTEWKKDNAMMYANFTQASKSENAGSKVLRFWRGNEDTLWNCSVALSYSNYIEGYNCINISGWNEEGNITKFKENDIDNDNVNDDIEALFNTDILKPDTDEDGLSDYIEIYKTGTDPNIKGY